MDNVRGLQYGSSVSFSKPEWVICGGRLSVNTVRVLASKELTHAELEAMFTTAAVGDSLFPDALVTTSSRVTLRVSMDHFIIIDGPDYAACLKYLFEQWSPDQDQPKAIDISQSAITNPARQIGP